MSQFLLVLFGFALYTDHQVSKSEWNSNNGFEPTFSYAQIFPTKDKEFDIVSIFTINSLSKIVTECNRTVFPSIRMYPPDAKHANEKIVAFGNYFDHDNSLMICVNLFACIHQFVIGPKKHLQYFTFDYFILFHASVTKYYK